MTTHQLRARLGAKDKPSNGDVMREALLYTASGLTILWGTAHLYPTNRSSKVSGRSPETTD